MRHLFSLSILTAVFLVPATSYAQVPDCSLNNMDVKIYFESEKSEVTVEAMAVVDQLAANIQAQTACSVDRVTLSGHTDVHESQTVSPLLSIGRAMKLATALVERGIVTDRYTLEGHGNRHLAAEGGERNPLNRRVEIKVTMRAN